MLRRILRLFLPNLTLRGFVKFLIIFTILFSAFMGIFVGILISSLYDSSAVKNLRYIAIPEPMKIYDKNGNLISELYTERRIPVSYSQISKDVVNAFIAVEDEDFFYHSGVSLKRIINAFIKNLLAGKVREGASTITQQLAKRVFTSGERNIFRKIIEIWYALQIEKEYSKQEIMEIYLNQIYFGYGAYGVEIASQIYFGKSSKDLTIAEAALLASIPKGPHLYSPFVNIENAKKRQYVVLKRMASLGFIPEGKVDEIYVNFWNDYINKVESLKLALTDYKQVAPFFVEYVRSVIAAKYGDDAVYKSGYKVYTTLDLRKQEIAEKYIKKYRDIAQDIYEKNIQVLKADNIKYLDFLGIINEFIPILEVKTSSRIISLKNNLRNLYQGIMITAELVGLESVRSVIFSNLHDSLGKVTKDKIECALVTIDSKTGYVEAMIGGSEFSPLNRFNRAIQAKRQLGSTFKPFLYSAGIDSKLITAATVFVDEPIEYRFAGGIWSPKNYEGSYMGKVTVRDAMAYSLNIVSVKILDKIGLGILRNYVQKFFALNKEEVDLYINSMASALGTLEVSPLDLAVAATVFPRGGTRIDPIMILRIEDKYGRVLEDFTKNLKQTNQQVISPQTAFIVTSMMKDVVNRGTGALIRTLGFRADAAGKTGTTSYWRDAWFVGFTGDGMVTSIWFGFDRSTMSMGRGMVGGRLAAPVFAEYLRDYYGNNLPPDIEIPFYSGITSAEICAESGKLATSFCPKTRVEYFLSGTEPTEKCDIHLKGYEENYQYPKEYKEYQKSDKYFIEKDIKKYLNY
ncbi:MAG: penicillin-binding protein 1A [Brevinematia bacterium]